MTGKHASIVCAAALLLLGRTLRAEEAVRPPGALPASIPRPQRGAAIPYSPPPARHAEYPFPDNSLLYEEALRQPLTRRYIGQYSSAAGIAWLEATMRRGNVYLAYIKGEIARRNLPPELVYLPVIESGYDGRARSRSGAVGLWQFMLNSVEPFDLRVNGMVDERRDFMKATGAALAKLQENYRALGSWELALAAYNAGLGGVRRVVERTKIRDYWALAERNELKTETIHYVPRLLAAAYILSRPRPYGIDLWPEAVEWTEIPVGRQASLALIARESGIDRDTLELGNMELLHGVTPADGKYRLKIPLDRYPLAAAVLEREDLKLLDFHRYVVRYGDTLSVLARHYGVSLAVIAEHNPGILDRYLRIGETVRIPALRETAPYAGPETGPRSFEGAYTVKKGDTLWSLALRYGLDPGELAGANGMELDQILPEGKRLNVPIIE